MTTSLFCLVLLSAGIHAAWNIAAKRVAGDMAVLWVAQLLAAAALAPLALAFGALPAPTAEVLRFLAVTGALQAAYCVLLSNAYRLGDLSLVYPVARGAGVAGAAVCGAVLLGEHLSPPGRTGIAAICAGSAMLGAAGLRRGAAGHHLPAVGLALLIGVDLAAGATNDKLAVAAIHPLDYSCAMFILGAALSAPLVLGRARAQLGRALRQHLGTAAIIGLGSAGGYLIILFAFRAGPMVYITGLRETSVVLGALWGFLARGERFSPAKGVGILLIVAGLVLIKLA